MPVHGASDLAYGLRLRIFEVIFKCNVIAVDQDEDIGQKLRAAREAAGLTVDDVVFQTQLPRSVILALEDGDFASFSSPVYAKSFLAQYSRFLEVDAHWWMDALEPGKAIEGGLLQPVFMAPFTPPVEPQRRGLESGGWLAALGLMLLSAMLIVMMVMSYQFFEARFGVDVPASSAQVLPEHEAATRGEVVSVSKTQAEREEDELEAVPPRAIIVR